MHACRRKLITYILVFVLAITGVFVNTGLVAEAKPVSRIRMDSTESGAYSGYHAVPDRTFLYKQGGKIHVVCLQSSIIKDYTLSGSYKAGSSKTVKLPSFKYWGGYYHSVHGYNYVAIGYSNPEEKGNKPVIRVIKYDKNWKKKGVANILGNSSNQFAGIYEPFSSGNVSFAEYQKTLYLFTSRKMFKTEDGQHHQSNIAFSIDTSSMKAKTDNVSYCSHSFNQYCRFEDGSLYAVDHGDAYPRGVKVTIYDAYGKFASDAGVGAHRGSATALSFQGAIGNNSTGATIGGMEISSSNVLVAGTSQPHNSTIDGVTGFSSSYGQNLYIIKRNRDTGKCSVRWLTNYNPKTSGVSVDRSRIVKINSNRFAVIYSILNRQTGARSTACVYIDGEGSTIKTQQFDKIQFRGGTQPIVSGNKIIWAEKPASGKTQIYEIPAK